MTCPECGRPVPRQGMPLCPHCGYPLLLDQPPPPDDSAHKIARKPTDTTAPEHRTHSMPGPGFPRGPSAPPPPRMQVRGPQCRHCGRINAPHRKRCETCAQELWPGAAFPARPQPPTPPAVPQARGRSWWWLVVLLLALAAIGTVWLLAWLL